MTCDFTRVFVFVSSSTRQILAFRVSTKQNTTQVQANQPNKNFSCSLFLDNLNYLPLYSFNNFSLSLSASSLVPQHYLQFQWNFVSWSCVCVAPVARRIFGDKTAL